LRPVVIPGEAVRGPGLQPGPATYIEGGQVFAAQLGIRNEHDGLVSVIPLNGRYIPQRGDAVIGEVVDLGPSHWLVDINSPYPAPLHTTESPWRVEFGDTSRYLKVGDVIMGHVLSVDEIKLVQLTMQEREARLRSNSYGRHRAHREGDEIDQGGWPTAGRSETGRAEAGPDRSGNPPAGGRVRVHRMGRQQGARRSLRSEGGPSEAPAGPG